MTLQDQFNAFLTACEAGTAREITASFVALSAALTAHMQAALTRNFGRWGGQ
jgi:hypothetical protein